MEQLIERSPLKCERTFYTALHRLTKVCSVIRQYDTVTFIVITPLILVVLVTCLVAMTIIPESNNLRTEELMLAHSLRMRKAWRQELVEPER